MFDQYPSPSLLESCQTWCGCPLRVDDPYWFSGHVVKGQSQNYWSLYKGCSLNIFWPFCLKVASLGIMDAPGKYMTPSDFQFTWSKVKVKLLVLIPSAVYTISYDLLFSIDSYELRSNYQLQPIEMQHLKKL